MKTSEDFSSMQTPAIEMLRQLVEIESYSGDETRAVEFLVGTMKTLGYDQAYVDAAGSAIGMIGNAQSEHTIVLLGHIDTVAGKIPVRIHDGILFGRGSVDAKGSLAAFVLAASMIQPSSDVQVVVCGAVEEESATSKGARQIARDFSADYCIIGEPSGSRAITLGYKGRLLIDYEIRVDEGHSAGPGQTAAELATAFWRDVLDHAERFNVPRPKLFDQLLPSLRSINSFSDGMQNSATAKIGCRLPPDFDVADYERMLSSVATGAMLQTYGYEAAYCSNRNNELVRAFGRSLRDQGIKLTYKRKTGTSDMNVVAPVWRCPIVAYGPGDSLLDHTPNEHLPLDEFLAAIEVLRSAMGYLIESIAERD